MRSNLHSPKLKPYLAPPYSILFDLMIVVNFILLFTIFESTDCSSFLICFFFYFFFIKVSITLDTKGNSNEKCEVETLNQWNKSADFPVINPSFSGYKNTCVYAAASSGSRPALPHFPFDTVAKLNVSNRSVSTWSVGHRRFIGEPIFVPKGVEEDDGYLLVVEVSKCIVVIYWYLILN